MHIEVDRSKCIGCGLCEEHLLELIEMGRHVAVLKQNRIPAGDEERAKTAVQDCPSGALRVTEASLSETGF